MKHPLVKIEMSMKHLSEVHAKIGYVRGLLIGMKGSIDELEGDKELVESAIISLGQLSDLLSANTEIVDG